VLRIDVCHALYKDRDLRDEPDGSLQVFSMNRPETHGVLRDWRRLGDSFDPGRVLLGEVYVLDVPRWASYYGSGSDELDLAFNFALVHSKLDASQMRSVVAETEAALPNDALPCWIGSNHDVGRLTTRWCDGDESLARCALLVLLCLRGTPCLFQGDELALPDGYVPEDRVRDVATPPRDPCRTPFPWTRAGGWDDPWLPLEDTGRNAEDQRADPESTLSYTRDLVALRRSTPDLTAGAYRELEAPSGAWAWQRGERTVVAVNLGSEPVEVLGVEGSIAIATRRERDGEDVRGTLALGPAEGAIVRT
jgi:alpha-glucosidase